MQIPKNFVKKLLKVSFAILRLNQPQGFGLNWDPLTPNLLELNHQWSSPVGV